MALTPKQERFYVYTLTDPRDGQVFYVGKGCGNRRFQHERDCRNGRVTNAAKHLRIQSVLNSGGAVVPTVVHSRLTEPEAISAERRLIREIGFANLTNILPGALTAMERSKVTAQAILSRVKDRDVWASEKPRSAYEIALADMVRSELEAIATHGQVSEVIISASGVEFR